MTAFRENLYKWWAIRILAGDREANVAMFRSPNAIVWA